MPTGRRALSTSMSSRDRPEGSHNNRQTNNNTSGTNARRSLSFPTGTRAESQSNRQTNTPDTSPTGLRALSLSTGTRSREASQSNRQTNKNTPDTSPTGRRALSLSTGTRGRVASQSNRQTNKNTPDTSPTGRRALSLSTGTRGRVASQSNRQTNKNTPDTSPTGRRALSLFTGTRGREASQSIRRTNTPDKSPTNRRALSLSTGTRSREASQARDHRTDNTDHGAREGEPTNRMMWRALNNVAKDIKQLKEMTEKSLAVGNQVLESLQSQTTDHEATGPPPSTPRTPRKLPADLRREARQIYKALTVDSDEMALAYRPGENFSSMHNAGVTRKIIEALKDGGEMTYRGSQLKMACRNIHDGLRRKEKEEREGTSDFHKRRRKLFNRRSRLLKVRKRVGKHCLSTQEVSYLKGAKATLMSDEESACEEGEKIFVVRKPPWRSQRLNNIICKCQKYIDKNVKPSSNTTRRKMSNLPCSRSAPNVKRKYLIDGDQGTEEMTTGSEPQRVEHSNVEDETGFAGDETSMSENVSGVEQLTSGVSSDSEESSSSSDSKSP
ncbi:uncharacterized protein LOC144928532 [Branchiostoma floridae x Branchiostoma belcheri]|nr:hypothetical protein Bbelb_334030 [Branchiostoma belcheri]